MNFRILLYWLIVAAPLSWGVLQSVNTALPLFGAKPLVIPYLTIPAPPPKPAPAALADPGARRSP